MTAWWRAWGSPEARLRRRARRELDALFRRHPERLQATSLRPDHRGRCQLLDVQDDPLRIGFGIVRHPRPYPFSRQVHEVLELWIYEPAGGRLERIEGRNLSRERGEDGLPSAHGPGI